MIFRSVFVRAIPDFPVLRKSRASGLQVFVTPVRGKAEAADNESRSARADRPGGFCTGG